MRIVFFILICQLSYGQSLFIVDKARQQSTDGVITPPEEDPYVLVDNAVKGTDGYEFNYVGDWPENTEMPTWFNQTLIYSGDTGDYFEITFNGTGIEWYTETRNTHGKAAIYLNDGYIRTIDLYSASQLYQQMVWDTTGLAQQEWTFKVVVTGTKNASSSAYWVLNDYVKIYNPEDVVPVPTDADLYVATAANGGSNSNPCSQAQPCLTLAYTVTQAIAGELIEIGPGDFTETSYVIVPAGVSIRGSGIGITVLRGHSSLWDDFDDFDYEFDKSLIQYSSVSETDGAQSLKNLTIDGTGTAYNDGTGPTHSTILNDRGMYGGVWIRNRNNVTIDGIAVRKCFFDAIMLFNTRNTKVLNCSFIDNAYGQTAFASGNIMWGGDYNDDMELAFNTVNENFGNGMKAFAAQASQGGVDAFLIHGNHISVTPTGQWAGGGAPNIGFENWGVPMTNCQLYDNYIDANVSLVNDAQDDDAVPTIRVYNNTIDMITRAAGENYCIELSVSYAEIDHNYLIGGRNGTIINFQIASMPTNAPWYGFWDIHHNVVIAPQSANPAFFVRGDNEGLNQVEIYNNTIDVDNIAGDGQSSHRAFALIASVAASSASANINVKNNVVWDKSAGGAAPFSNRIVFGGSGATWSSVSITHNDFYSITQNAVTGVTYSSNITTVPGVNGTGVKPDPFYIPVNGGNLNDAGTNVGLPFVGAAPDIGAYEID